MPKGYKRSDNLTKEIILTLARVGVFAIGATSPYFLSAMIKYYFHKKIQERARRLKELEKKKLVEFQYLVNNEVRVTLTHRGKTLVRQYELDDLKLQRPDSWDKKWRIIIYDIPSAHKKGSLALSKKFHTMGLYKLQKSVWVSPYDCMAELEFICAVFEININTCFHYITTPEIPEEQKLKRFFNL